MQTWSQSTVQERQDNAETGAHLIGIHGKCEGVSVSFQTVPGPFRGGTGGFLTHSRLSEHTPSPPLPPQGKKPPLNPNTIGRGGACVMVERKQTVRFKDTSTRALSISSIIIFIITFLSHSLSPFFFFFFTSSSSLPTRGRAARCRLRRPRVYAGAAGFTQNILLIYLCFFACFAFVSGHHHSHHPVSVGGSSFPMSAMHTHTHHSVTIKANIYMYACKC